MEGYKVSAYRAYATSAIREAKNRLILLDYIEEHTGLKIEVLSNSEQRFLDYKSIASRENEFNTIIQKGTAIVDVGGGSIQIFEIRGIQKFPPLRMRVLTALRQHAARKRQRTDHGKDCRRAFCCLFVCHKFPPCGKTSPPALPYIRYLYGF